jgi:hypothetical protein
MTQTRAGNPEARGHNCSLSDVCTTQHHHWTHTTCAYNGSLSNSLVEDWTGKTDPKERKKLQDRINQRISSQLSQYTRCPILLTDHLRYVLRLKGRRKKAGHWQREIDLQAPRAVENSAVNGPLAGENTPWPYSAYQLALSTHQPKSMDINSFTACEPDSERTEQFILHFSAWLHEEYLRGSPRADTLLSLVQFNMTRALVANAKILGITKRLMSRQARSRFASTGVETAFIDSLPPSLQPTIFQLTIPHHSWIDLIPVPEIRDNLLHLDVNSYDAAQLCRDMRGFQEVAGGRGGVAVWGQSWDPHGWEISPAFAQKWPWVVQRCERLLKSTNYWRGIRGEPPLQFGHDVSPSQDGPLRVEELEQVR